MRRFIFAISLVLSFQGIVVQAWGQDYQRAKDVLKGVVSKDTTLYQFPSPTSKRIIKLNRNTPVFIYGKQGGFLDVRYGNLKGWGDSRSFIIQGVATDAQEPVKPVETVRPQSIPEPSKPKLDLPIRVNPFVMYSMKGKSFEKQVRLGGEATYALSNYIAVGAVTDLVFVRGTYFDFGPIVRHQWIKDSQFFNPAFYVGFLYYQFDRNSVSDKGFGIQWAFENDIPIYQSKAFQPAVTFKAGMDMMFFYFQEVRIPVFIAGGASFKF